MMNSLKRKVIVMSFLVGIAGAAIAEPPQSQFLDVTENLTPVPGIEGSYGWDNPKLPVSDYDKFFLDNVQIFLAPDSPYKGIDASQMQAISQTFRAVMIATLEPEYPVVSQPGPGVMRMSLAITNLSITKKRKGLINYTPVGLVVGGLRSLADEFSNVSLEAATVEADIVDSISGELIAARIATKPFAQAGVGEGKLSWNTLESAFGFYASEVRKSMDAAHGKK